MTSGNYPEGDAPLVVVVGNCQAESLRIMLGSTDIRSVRLPAVHELVEADLPYLIAILGLADVLVAQPVRDDYHGLPIGTAQMRAVLRPDAVTVVVPVIRFAGLYPLHAIIRPPMDLSLEPPIVPYHDLGTLARAAGLGEVRLTPRSVRAISRLSIHELERRAREHDAIAMGDVFTSPDFDCMRTMNHPGNSVFAELARRVRARAGLPEFEFDPGRQILANIHAPRHPAVINTFELDALPTTGWVIDGHEIEEAEVRAAHLAWYQAHPEVVAAGLARHADTMRILRAA